LFVIYYDNGRRIISFYFGHLAMEKEYLTGYFAGHNFYGDLFEIAVAFTVVTVILIAMVKSEGLGGSNA
jgi:hypothetical protein